MSILNVVKQTNEKNEIELEINCNNDDYDDLDLKL